MNDSLQFIQSPSTLIQLDYQLFECEKKSMQVNRNIQKDRLIFNLHSRKTCAEKLFPSKQQIVLVNM